MRLFRHPHPSRRISGVSRYLAGWLAATLAAVGVALVALGPGPERPEAVTVAAERAACRFEKGDDGAPPGDRVVVRYRATLRGGELARVRALARRLADRTITRPDGDPGLGAVVAIGDDEQLECPRVDRRAEDAIVVFVLSAREDD